MLLKKSGGIFSIIIVSAGNFIGTFISAIALILFSRIMGPAEFGVFSAAFAAMLIIVRLSDMGINTAVERQIARESGKSLVEVDRYMRLALWLKLGFAFIVIAVGWAISPYLAHNVLRLDSVNILRLAFLASVGTIFFEYTALIFQATQKFGMVARITIAQAVGKLIVGLILIWQGALTATTGILLYGLMPFFGALTAWKPRPISSYRLPKKINKEVFALSKVARWTAVAAISATLADNIDTLMVQSLMSSFDTGLFAAAARIAAFASIIGWSIGIVLSNRVASYTTKEHLHTYLSKAWKLAIGAFLGLLLIIPFSSLAISLTVGNEYLAATPVLQVLILASSLTAATTPFVALFYLFNKPKYYAISGVLQTAILLTGNYILVPQMGLMGAAYVRIIVRIFVLLFTLWYARRAYVEYFHSR